MCRVKALAPLPRRAIAGALIAAGALLTLTSCDLFAPQETKQIREAATGVNGSIGEIFIGNAVVLTHGNGGGPGSLVVTFVNTSNTPQTITVHANGAAAPVTLKAAATEQIGGHRGRQIILRSVDAKPGALTIVTFESGGYTTALSVPVLNGELPQYAGLVP